MSHSNLEFYRLSFVAVLFQFRGLRCAFEVMLPPQRRLVSAKSVRTSFFDRRPQCPGKSIMSSLSPHLRISRRTRRPLEDFPRLRGRHEATLRRQSTAVKRHQMPAVPQNIQFSSGPCRPYEEISQSAGVSSLMLSLETLRLRSRLDC